MILTPGPRFGPDGAFEARLRLPFARPPGELAAAVARIGRAWRDLTGAGGPSTQDEDDVLVV